MAYALGVDLGTTFTAAAIGSDGRAEPLQLGNEVAHVPSVVVVRADGEVLVGDAAERRATVEPARTAREFKRRLGDAVPLMLGGTPFPVPQLMGLQLRDVIRRAAELQGGSPSIVVLTHPANYTDFKRDALREVAREAGVADEALLLLTEPEAAAVAYARQQRVEPGEVVAIYDFGGGTFDAALVRNTGDRFELIGVPEGMERLGGVDIDLAVLGHVDRSLDGLVSGADRSDPEVLPAQTRLRIDCRRAKETLSADADTTIAVDLPGVHTSVRLTRTELEEMVRPRLAETVASLQRAVASADISIDDVSRILLVGGSSRMPLVAEMVRSATGRPVAVDVHPKLAIAIGAALVGASQVERTAAERTDPGPAGAATGSGWEPPVRTTPPKLRAPKRSRRVAYAAAGVAAGAATVVTVVTLMGSDSGSRPSGATATVSRVGSETTEPSSTSASPATAATSVASTDPTSSVAPASSFVSERVAFGADPGTGIPGPALEAGVERIVALAAASDVVYVADGGGSILQFSEGRIEPYVQLDGPIGGMAVFGDTLYVTEPRGVTAVVDGVASLFLDGATIALGDTPGPVAADGVGNLYVADNDGNRIVRRGTDGSLSLVAGNGDAPPAAAGADDGRPAIEAAIGDVVGLALDTSGRLVVADADSGLVRTVTPDGVIGTLAGSGSTPLVQDGIVAPDGTAAGALAFSSLVGLAVDPDGRVFVSDAAGVIVRISLDGRIETVIGPTTDDATTDQDPSRVLGPSLYSSEALLYVDEATVRAARER